MALMQRAHIMQGVMLDIRDKIVHSAARPHATPAASPAFLIDSAAVS
jgi:hypothetical protein